MLAPEPFFEPRGTPFSEYHRIKALVELGYAVDLVTYPIGRDVHLPNLRIYRCLRPPFVKRVAIGPSWLKVLLDLLLAATALRLAGRVRYAAIHSHEEAGVLGVWLARWLNIPHLYDMHSSLPQQLSNFSYSRSRPVRYLFEWLERNMIRGSQVVITICQELFDTVVAIGAGDRTVLIENVMGGDMGATALVPVRQRWDISAATPLVVYTGTFEAYQGLDLLYAAVRLLRKTHPEARTLIVGGEPHQVREARAEAERDRLPLIFAGRRPAEEIPAFIAACDILVSPRTAGTNTPLKIYSYLRSGRPILATDLRTHTQVLETGTAMLVPPEPAALAMGIGQLIDKPAERARLAAAALELARRKYSRAVYMKQTQRAYRKLLGVSALDGTTVGEGGHAAVVGSPPGS